MMEYINNITLFLVLSTIIYKISSILQSDFIESFLKDNLITLLFALMAINTTTISVIMTKLREISDANNVDFTKTIKALKDSIIEQVVLLFISVFVLMLHSSKLLVNSYATINAVTTVLLITTLLYAVQILYDTAQSVFVIATKENALIQENNKK